MYNEELLEHYKYPHNTTPLNTPTFSSGKTNPSCGDIMHIEGIINENIMTHICFRGKGCVISQAAASMLTEYCKGKDIDTILAISSEKMAQLVGIPLGPVRLKCATLCLEVLKSGILEFQNQNKNS